MGRNGQKEQGDRAGPPWREPPAGGTSHIENCDWAEVAQEKSAFAYDAECIQYSTAGEMQTADEEAGLPWKTLNVGGFFEHEQYLSTPHPPQAREKDVPA